MTHKNSIVNIIINIKSLYFLLIYQNDSKNELRN